MTSTAVIETAGETRILEMDMAVKKPERIHCHSFHENMSAAMIRKMVMRHR
jgi:hypothetical protein